MGALSLAFFCNLPLYLRFGILNLFGSRSLAGFKAAASKTADRGFESHREHHFLKDSYEL